MNASIHRPQQSVDVLYEAATVTCADLKASSRDADMTHPTADDLKRHPAFRHTRDMVIANLVQLFRGDYLLSRLLLEEGRFITFQAILCLSACQIAEERETWLTLGRLQTHLTPSGLTSRNRIEALVAIFERYGFLERRKAEEDLRISLLVPSARMWSSDAAFLDAQTAPLALMADLPDLGERAKTAVTRLRVAAQQSLDADGAAPASLDPVAPAWSARSLGPATAGHRSWRRSFAAHLPAFLAMRARHDAVMRLTERDGGYLVFLLLLQEGLSLGSDRVCMPYETISESTGVSRTHARLLMEQAEALGLVSLRARGGRDIALLDALWTAADDWFADNISFLMRSL